MRRYRHAALTAGIVVFLVAVVGLSAGQCQFAPTVTDDDRAVVQAVLDREEPADRITSGLVELLLSEQWGVREVAAQELMQRELDKRDLNKLQNIVLMVPFDSQDGDVVLLEWAGMYVGSRQAWEVLAHANTDGKPLDEQIEWYVTQLRYAQPYDSGVASAASQRLLEIGEPAVPRLIRAIQREATWTQHWAAVTLERLGTADAMAAAEGWALHALAEIDDPFILQRATYSLGRLRSVEAFEPLQDLLWQRLEEHWSWAIIDSLVQIDPDRAREPLLRILEGHQPEAGRHGLIEPYLRSARHLATLGEERGWTALEEAVHSPLPEVRRELAGALAATWNARARESLVVLTQDENEQVARSATYSLDNLDQGLKRMEDQQ